MKKIVEITCCNHCRYFDSAMGAKCFHPKVVKPHSEGCIPKSLIQNSFDVQIPRWCPLETILPN